MNKYDNINELKQNQIIRNSSEKKAFYLQYYL